MGYISFLANVLYCSICVSGYAIILPCSSFSYFRLLHADTAPTAGLGSWCSSTMRTGSLKARNSTRCKLATTSCSSQHCTADEEPSGTPKPSARTLPSHVTPAWRDGLANQVYRDNWNSLDPLFQCRRGTRKLSPSPPAMILGINFHATRNVTNRNRFLRSK